MRTSSPTQTSGKKPTPRPTFRDMLWVSATLLIPKELDTAVNRVSMLLRDSPLLGHRGDFTTFSVEMRRVRVVEVSPKTEVSVEAEAYWLDIDDAPPIVPSPVEFNARWWPGDQTEVKATLRHFPELARDFEDLTRQIINIWQGAECTKVETNAAEDDPNHKDWLSLAKRLGTKPIASLPPVPSRKADLRRWKATWKTTKGQWMQGIRDYKEICDWLHKTHPKLGCSTDTLVKIIRAGEAGLLDD